MDIEARIELLRDRLDASEADALIVTKTSNVAYLTGLVGIFDEHADAACCVTADEARLFTSFIYAKPARPAAADGPWTLVETSGGFYESLCEAVTGLGAQTLAIESSVPYGRFRYVSEHCEGRIEVVEQWVEDLRLVKEPEEVERISASAELADKGFAHILERIEAGRTEREIALDLEFYLRTNGSDGVAFDPIVASGPNAANPHATVTDRVLGKGDVLKMDFGARVGGYCSDLTRTVVVGRPDPRLTEMHAAVLAANEAGRDAVRGGRRASDIDEAARAVIRERGFGEEFGHGLGHGVGLDVHESPRIGPRSDDSVPTGAVVTVEPGVYVDGFAGVRIEDLVAVTDEGCRLLSHAPRELIEL